MPPSLPSIPDSEWKVMQLLWDHSPLTAAQIADRLASPNGWSPKTVMTLIHRLVKKGAVAYDKQGRAHLYRPKLKQSQCVRAQSRSFLEKVFRGATMPMLAQFLEEARLTPDQIKELQQILDKKSQ